MQHRVVVVGGGFAGLSAVRKFGNRDVAVTLIDRRNHHIFQPLLYQVATGALSPGEISSPLRGIVGRLKNVTALLAEVQTVDLAARIIDTTAGPMPFDTLIVAAGSETSYFGNTGWEEHATGLKTVEEATEIRSRIFYAFEQAELTADPMERRDWLTFVIVGAGPTGVVLAGALGEIAKDTLRGDFRRIRPEEARILLVDGNQRVLGSFAETLSRKAENDLVRLGVRFRPDVRVVGVDESSVKLKLKSGAEEVIRTRTILWAAGVKASPLGKQLATLAGVECDRAGRVKVLADCSLAGYPNVFIIGDLAQFVLANGKQLPGVAQVALQQGEFVADLILKRLSGEAAESQFQYWDKGNMATIGRGRAVAEVGKAEFFGFVAWVMWLGVHLLYLVEFRNRVAVALQWGFQYLTFARGARLITGVERFLRPRPAPRE